MMKLELEIITIFFRQEIMLFCLLGSLEESRSFDASEYADDLQQTTRHCAELIDQVWAP